jgi:hypothetical protein
MFEDPCLASHGGAHDVLPIMPNLISRRTNGKQGAKAVQANEGKLRL